ncbi:putative transmembrane protein [Nitrosomonas sp. Is79A3]|uniref:membrane protein n=1 Tax=Nitrosomonas sp. (strain Is79A3) TaxID=261292 RepID=UPI000215D473
MLNEQVQKSNRRKLLLLLALMCAPVVISYALYFLDYKPESKHYGDLIPIVKVTGKATNQVDNTILRMKDLHGKWVLVTIDSGHCDEACQQKLYFMRQVRLVQGKQKHRIERLWLINDDVIPDAELVKEYEGTFFAKAQDSEILGFIETKEIQTKHIYLIDPMGNLMMRFPENVDGTKMGHDIKRLLHVSQLEH